MPSYFRLTVILILWSVALLTPYYLLGEDGHIASDTMEQLRQAFLDAKTPIEAQKAYNASFKRMTEAELEDAAMHPNHTLALHAAWLRSQQPRVEGGVPQPQRFIGFLEGRIRVRIPVRWEYNLVCYSLRDQPDLLYASTAEYARHCTFLEKSDVGPNRWAYQRNRLCKVCLNLKNPDDHLLRQKGDRLIVTVGDFPWQADLVRAEFQTEKSLWKAKAWGLANKPNRTISTGPSYHEVEVVITDNTVILFGNNHRRQCYLEAFDPESGRVKYRFSSTMNESRRPGE